MRVSGFTLIELLIVIAVLGVLAAITLVAIDPLEQIARGRDGGRRTTVGQLGRALQAYYTNHAQYLPTDTTWMAKLVSAGEIKSLVAEITNGKSYTCWPDASGNAVNNFCYTYTGTEAGGAYVWTVSESKSEASKCPNNPGYAYISYSTVKGKACLRCGSYNLPCAQQQ